MLLTAESSFTEQRQCDVGGPAGGGAMVVETVSGNNSGPLHSRDNVSKAVKFFVCGRHSQRG